MAIYLKIGGIKIEIGLFWVVLVVALIAWWLL